MSQTSYSMNHLAAYEGGRGNSAPALMVTGRNNSGSAMPYGRFVVHDTGSGTSEIAVKPPSAAGQKVLGVSLFDVAHEVEAVGIADDAILSIIKQGAVWMIAEGTVGPSDPVYMRHTAAVSPAASDAIGRVGKIAGGVAEIYTITPGAAQHAVDIQLTVNVSGKSFTFITLTDGTMTATEVADAFRALMAADAVFTALVVATGTATLILTSVALGVPFDVTVGAGVMVDVVTAASADCELVANASFLTSATIGLPVMVLLNLP